MWLGERESLFYYHMIAGICWTWRNDKWTCTYVVRHDGHIEWSSRLRMLPWIPYFNGSIFTGTIHPFWIALESYWSDIRSVSLQFLKCILSCMIHIVKMNIWISYQQTKHPFMDHPHDTSARRLHSKEDTCCCNESFVMSNTEGIHLLSKIVFQIVSE